MTIAKPNALSNLPVLGNMVGDVTESIIFSLDRPAMRSMARTNKVWNFYLKNEWSLHDLNCNDAIQLVNSSDRPRLRLLRCMEKLVEVASGNEAQWFATAACYGVNAVNDSDLADLMTVFSAMIERPLPDTLQGSLEHIQPWDEISTNAKKQITRLVDSIFEKNSEKKTGLQAVLAVIRELSDHAKYYAFMKLISGFTTKRDFSNSTGDFWVGREHLASKFISVAHELVPKTWDKRLTLYSKQSLPKAGFFSGSFVGMAILCLTKFRRNEELGAALLRMVVASARHLPNDQRSWKGLRDKVNKETGYELHAISTLIHAVLNLCLRNKETKNASRKIYKEILCGGGFLTKDKWEKFTCEASYFSMGQILVSF